jgi:hypothetical protein
MSSNVIVNYYEYFLINDDKYKELNREFQKQIYIFNDLMGIAKSK